MNKLCGLHPALCPAVCRTPTEHMSDLGPHFSGALQKLTTFLSNLTGKINGRISPSMFTFAALLLMNSPMFTSYWLWLTIWKITLEKIWILKVLFPIFRKTALFFFKTFVSNSLTIPVPRIFYIQSELFCLVRLNVSFLCSCKVKHSS